MRHLFRRLHLLRRLGRDLRRKLEPGRRMRRRPCCGAHENSITSQAMLLFHVVRLLLPMLLRELAHSNRLKRPVPRPSCPETRPADPITFRPRFPNSIPPPQTMGSQIYPTSCQVTTCGYRGACISKKDQPKGRGFNGNKRN